MRKRTRRHAAVLLVAVAAVSFAPLAGCEFGLDVSSPDYVACDRNRPCIEACSCFADSICVPRTAGLPPEACCDNGNSCASPRIERGQCIHEHVACDSCDAVETLAEPAGEIGGVLASVWGSIDPRGIPGCLDPAPGAERVFRIEVPGDHHLQARLETTQGNEILYLTARCGPDGIAACQAWANQEYTGPERLEFTNYGATGDFFLVSDLAAVVEADVPFTLTWNVEPLPPGNLCATRQVLSGAGGSLDGTLAFADDNFDPDGAPGCGGAARGPDVVYQVDIPGGYHFRATLDSGSGNEILYLMDACTEGVQACVAWANAAYYDPERLEFSNNGTPGSFYLVVDQADWGSAGSTFTLDWELGPLPEGNACTDAAALDPAGGTIDATLALADNDLDPDGAAGCGGAASGPDVSYKVDIPGGYHFRATLDSSTGNELLYLMDTCTEGVQGCVAWANAAYYDPERLEFSNYGVAATYFLVVDLADWRSAGSSFSLSWQLGPLPEGNVCTGAEALEPAGGTIDATLVLADNNLDPDGAAGCGGAASGPDVVYRIDIPGGHHFRATLDSSTGNEILYLMDGCTDMVQGCVAWANAAYYDPERLEFSNYGVAATYYLVADLADWRSAGSSFNLAWEMGPHPDGNGCATAVTLAELSGTYQGSLEYADDNFETDGAPGCGGAAGGPDQVFAVVLPAGHTLQATLDSTSGNELLYLLDDCVPLTGQCVAWANDTYWSPETLSFTNPGEQAVFYLVVDLADWTTAGSGYELTWQVGP